MIEKIGNDCTSCTACINICPKQCISIEKNEDDFDYLRIDKSKCVRCNKCENICPVINEINSTSLSIKAYAIKNKDEKIRLNSTSGGVFSLLANYVLENNGYVVGAAYDRTFNVKHIIVNDKSELYKLRGAKYIQSELGNIFTEIKQLLIHNKLVLFSGTPCQCIGLKSYLKKDYRNLIIVDLICHGVPSSKVWQSYIDYRANKENNGIRPIKINMRCKDSGWTNYAYSTEFTYENGKKTLISSENDLFMKAFVGNICLRPSCSNCKAKGLKRTADFTLGDYWGIWNQCPEFDDDKGVSAVFVHSDKAIELLHRLNNQLELLEVDVQKAYEDNSSFIKPSKSNLNRNEFLKHINANNFEELINKYFSIKKSKNNMISRIERKLKRVIFNKKE